MEKWKILIEILAYTLSVDVRAQWIRGNMKNGKVYSLNRGEKKDERSSFESQRSTFDVHCLERQREPLVCLIVWRMKMKKD